jgi:16S rRNA A1518/A1519 N6-dimethyltransferase RsmA/KsgA/DIM1 with predicted DNA glycosylase/AP lyase activity
MFRYFKFILIGPPFFPISEHLLGLLINTLTKYKIKHAIDVGSGDGKILKALAKNNIYADGIEINPFLYKRTKHLNINKYIKVHKNDMWRHNLNSYDGIIYHGYPTSMAKFEEKTIKEVKKGAYVICIRYKLPNLKPIEQIETLYIYKF